MQPNTAANQELVFHVPAYKGSDTGLGRRTIGHVDITLCAAAQKQASDGSKVAKPFFDHPASPQH
jgi:hypothetical protein